MKSKESMIYDMVRREVQRLYPDADIFTEAYRINRLLVEMFGPEERDRIIEKTYEEAFGEEE